MIDEIPIRTDINKYNWMRAHVIRDRRALKKIQSAFPDRQFFPSFKDCDKWLFEQAKKNGIIKWK